jgi:hypothetical protein
VKKVRYAIGAVGVAPALGLVVPAATAAVTHVPRPVTGQAAAKTVSLQHTGVDPGAVRCAGTFSNIITLASPNFTARLSVTGHCLLRVSGFINFTSSPVQPHLMRTRVYSTHGARVFSSEVKSSVSGESIRFPQSVGVKGRRACEAIFLAKHPHKVLYGPLCERI